jgi:hypothetical protein
MAASSHLLGRTRNPAWVSAKENGHIESFNGRLRDECLNVMQFMSLEDARAKIDAWRIDYNQRRPHSSPGHLTPSEFVRSRQATRTREAAEPCSRQSAKGARRSESQSTGVLEDTYLVYVFFDK